MQQYIAQSFLDSINLKQLVMNTMIDRIAEMVDIIKKSIRIGGKVILFGNGGSAADSQHIAAELIGNGFPAISLTTDTSVITAIANDIDYADIFSEQVINIASRFDVIIAISTSGNSQNIINGLNAAKIRSAKSIALLGNDGGKIKGLADLSLVVPSKNTARIQEVHITIGHIVCDLLK